MSHYFKPFEELEFSDDFIFGKVMQNPEICAQVIECLLKIKVDHIEYPVLQKEIRPYYTSKGIRLDVYVKDSDRIFDIEMQTQIPENLLKRIRYYQSILDADDLMRGADYTELKESYIIFICKELPFNRSKQPVYDLELKDRFGSKELFDDKIHRLIYNACAYDKESDSRLKDFLHFVCSNKSEDDFSNILASFVSKLKQNEANKTEYNNMNLHDRDIIRATKKEVAYQTSVNNALNMLKDNLPADKISLYTGLSLEQVQKLVTEKTEKK